MDGATRRAAGVRPVRGDVRPAVGLGEVLLAGVSREGRGGVPATAEAATEGVVTMYVSAREGETFEELFRRFKRGVEAAGILRDYRRKQRFKPAHEERRDKIRAAQRKRRRARAKRFSSSAIRAAARGKSRAGRRSPSEIFKTSER